MGFVTTNTCPNCNALDMPMHTLIECDVSKQVLERLMIRMPKRTGLSLVLSQWESMIIEPDSQ
jgi:hypothetical protein